MSGQRNNNFRKKHFLCIDVYFLALDNTDDHRAVAETERSDIPRGGDRLERS